MIDIIVKSVFPKTEGIMYYISQEGSYEFSDDMDLLLISKCGNRTITPIVEMILNGAETLSGAHLQRLANIILVEYGEAWNRFKSALELEYNPLSASQYNETESFSEEGETSNESSGTQRRGVAAADTVPANYVSDDENTNNTEDSGSSSRSSTRTIQRTSNGTSYKSSELITSEMDMRLQRRFMSQVLDDVKNYIAMQIY